MQAVHRSLYERDSLARIYWFDLQDGKKNRAASGDNGFEVIAEERRRGNGGVVEETHNTKDEFLFSGSDGGVEDLEKTRKQRGEIGNHVVVDLGRNDVAARFDGHRENLRGEQMRERQEATEKSGSFRPLLRTLIRSEREM